MKTYAQKSVALKSLKKTRANVWNLRGSIAFRSTTGKIAFDALTESIENIDTKIAELETSIYMLQTGH